MPDGYYSEWFGPFPWTEMKITEFPGLAYYAQGFPTNISFSEKIGFLTYDSPGSNSAFLVTAHESSHQWWANILTPGKGPGGNVIAEGLAQCSTLMLADQVYGDAAQRTFATRLETDYSETRQRDSEKPLHRIDGTRPGDQTVTYNKGGWVFYMLMQVMGRDAFLEGLQDFVSTYRDEPDYPVIEDFIELMRTHARDPNAFDTYSDQWFLDVVIPEYSITQATREKSPDSDTWTVKATVKSIGTRTMPVAIAATIDEPYDKDGYRNRHIQENETSFHRSRRPDRSRHRVPVRAGTSGGGSRCEGVATAKENGCAGVVKRHHQSNGTTSQTPTISF